MHARERDELKMRLGLVLDQHLPLAASDRRQALEHLHAAVEAMPLTGPGDDDRPTVEDMERAVVEIERLQMLAAGQATEIEALNADVARLQAALTEAAAGIPATAADNLQLSTADSSGAQA